MNAGERAVSFVNRQGHRLFGIVHEPARASDAAIILLSPGIKNRVAPHRLYNTMAAAFVEQGYWVLRFDFYGLGDSEGMIDERYLADLYGSIQVGRYVEDTWVAMDWMRAELGVRRFVLGGLCGGAITGVLAAPARDDVVGILALGLPVMLDGTKVDKHRYMTAGQLDRVRSKYLRKLLDPGSWLRLLRMQSDFRLLFRSVMGKRRPAASGSAPADPGNTNTLFPPAMLELLARGCPVLLLFSEMDRLWWEFEEKFLHHHRAAFERHAHLAELGVVSGANHVFTLEEWQQDMLERCGSWLQRSVKGPVEPQATVAAG